MQEWLHVTGGHITVEYCSGSHLKESGFRSIDLSLLALGRGLRRRIVARVRGVLGHLPHTASLWLAVWLATAVPTSRAECVSVVHIRHYFVRSCANIPNTQFSTFHP